MPGEAADRGSRSESLYFRASPELREAAEEFATSRGSTLSTGLSRLVELGLEASANEESIRRLEASLAQASAEIAQLRVGLATREGDLQRWQAVVNGLAGYLRNLRVGSCPKCKRQVTGYDQAVTHQCPNCTDSLAQVVTEADFTPVAAGILGVVGGLLMGLAAGGQSGGGGAG